MNLNNNNNPNHLNFVKSFKTNTNLNNNNFHSLYPYDSFRPGNFLFDNYSKENNSVSPNKFLTHKDFFKVVKRNNTTNMNEKINIIDGKSKSLIKINDIERKNEEIRRYKQDFNEKVREMHAIKISFLKLDQENKRNIKIIEDMIVETAKEKINEEVFSFPPEDYYKELKNFLHFGKTSDKLLSKLIESHAINNLKRQIFDFKQKIAKQDSEISKLKENSRYTKYHDLEQKLNTTVEEMTSIKEDYFNLKNIYTEKESNLKSAMEEKEYFKKLYNSIKMKYDEFKNKINEHEKLNVDLQEKIKKLEDINSNNKYQNLSFKNQIKERDDKIINLKENLKALEDFRAEKEIFQKNLLTLNSNFHALKEDLEKKNVIVKSLQRQNADLKSNKNNTKNNCIGHIEENTNLTWNNMPIPWKIVIKEKDKKILVLEKEINKLQNEIDKLNREIHSLKTYGSVGKIKINCLPNSSSNQTSSKEKFFISCPDGVTNTITEKTKNPLLNHKLNKLRNSKQENNEGNTDIAIKDEIFNNSNNKSIVDDNSNKYNESINQKQEKKIENKDQYDEGNYELNEDYQQKDLKYPSEFMEENNFYKQGIDKYSEENDNYKHNYDNPSELKNLELAELEKKEIKKKNKKEKKKKLKSMDKNNDDEFNNLPNSDYLQYDLRNNENYYDNMRNDLVSRERPLNIEKQIDRGQKSKKFFESDHKKINEEDYYGEENAENNDFAIDKDYDLQNNNDFDFKNFGDEKKKKAKKPKKKNKDTRPEDDQFDKLQFQTGQNFFKSSKNDKYEFENEEFDENNKHFQFKDFKNNIDNNNIHKEEINNFEDLEKREKLILQKIESKKKAINPENSYKNFDLISNNENNSNYHNKSENENSKNYIDDNFRRDSEKTTNIINDRKNFDKNNLINCFKQEQENLNNSKEEELEKYQEFEDPKNEIKNIYDEVENLQKNSNDYEDFEFEKKREIDQNNYNSENNMKIENNVKDIDYENENFNEEYNENAKNDSKYKQTNNSNHDKSNNDEEKYNNNEFEEYGNI